MAAAQEGASKTMVSNLSGFLFSNFSDHPIVCVNLSLAKPRHVCGATVHRRGGKATNTNRTKMNSMMIMHVQADTSTRGSKSEFVTAHGTERPTLG